MRPHLSITDAENILIERYPDLRDHAGEAPALLAAVGLVFLGADLRAAELGNRPVRPVTRLQLDAAMALAGAAVDGAEYAELVVAAHLRAADATWQEIADLRGYARQGAARTRFDRLRKRHGVAEQELPAAPTLPAHTARAARYIETATANRPLSPFLARTAADVLGALLLAARYDQATGTDLRTWAEDPTFSGSVDGLAAAPREAAEAAHQVLTDTAALPAGTRADITAVVLAGIDVWDPPTSQDRT
ncbi:hypothetical protein [Nocardiopsis tropica]|uniref:Golgi phosphoprotein 3 (GPP34) n=1 Tax=Nocardiopsis tropica TaxID=109330 RepID=A0ABU7KR92_9ACTN|nr:hypothetical protein [Nocardiopsis umidischolae]MEE2051825.1 hypothetical protein [Nocardiopsis umidischolae]